jgi:mannose-6-phosphate isomerase
MSIKNYGGNFVSELSAGKIGRTLLGEGPYEYFIYEASNNEQIKIENLRSYSIYVLEKPNKCIISIKALDSTIEQGDRIQVENSQVTITITGSGVKLLVAGTRTPHPTLSEVSLTKKADIYKVIKPWGHELWINNQHPNYAFKEIFIKAGHKTSLQYHRLKQETNVLFAGIANLHYKQNGVVKIDEVSSIDISTLLLNPISIIDVLPLTLHRLEAVTDIILYEVSTPHLDDVIRISDDSGRPNGRINQEHLKIT